MKKTVFVILLSICAVTLTACGGTEPNEIAYVVALGIDKSDSGVYDVTIQYANPTQISGGASEEGGKSGSEIVENMTVEAPNIYSAIGLANHIVSKTFSLAHAKIIVFSGEVAEAGLRDITETFIRSEELRPDVYLAVAPDGAKEYLKAVQPEMEINPAKYYQLVYDKNNLMGIPEGAAKNFFFGIETGDYDSLLPIAGVAGGKEESQGGEGGESGGGEGSSGGGGSESGGEGGSGGSSQGGSESGSENEKQSEAPMNESGFEYKMKNYVGGEAAVEIKNKSEAMGSAVFDGDKMVGTLGSVETELFKLLIGDYKHSYLSFYNEKTPDDPVTVKTEQEKSPKYEIDAENKKIKVELFLEGDVYSLPSDYNLESDIENFENNSAVYISEACSEFMTDFLNKYDSDIFKLNEKSKKRFLTNDEYEEYKNNTSYRGFDAEVKVNFKIRRSGLVVREKQ